MKIEYFTVVRGLGISQVPSSHVGTTPSIVIWLNTIYYTTDQPFTWRSGKSLVHSYSRRLSSLGNSFSNVAIIVSHMNPKQDAL